MEITNKKITIVGCGPGSSDYITPAAQRAVAKAKVLAGAQRLLELFPESSAERIIVTGHITDVLDQIQLAAKDRSVAGIRGVAPHRPTGPFPPPMQGPSHPETWRSGNP